MRKNYKRTINFSPGPASLPKSVLERIHLELFDFNCSGLSVMELSHRSDYIQSIISDAELSLRRLYDIDDSTHIAFVQGGGSQQFALLPMNFSKKRDKVDYIDTGYWSQKAIAEAKFLGRNVAVIASSKDTNYSNIPNIENILPRPNTKYLHICTNNTIYGTQWHNIPTVSCPLVADMSSDFASREFDINRFGFIYAHAQKNIGIAGVTVLLAREEMLNNICNDLPAIFNYKTHFEYKSNYQTPPCFAIYVTWLVLNWIETKIGGLSKLGDINEEKSKRLYNYIDSSEMYSNQVNKDYRSKVNVIFSLRNTKLESEFINQAKKNNIIGIQGHRSLGGLRASLYNGVTKDDVKKLIEFMNDFAKKNL